MKQSKALSLCPHHEALQVPLAFLNPCSSPDKLSVPAEPWCRSASLPLQLQTSPSLYTTIRAELCVITLRWLSSITVIPLLR